MTCSIGRMTYTARICRVGDKLSASIRLPLIKQIDSGNITAARGSFKKLRGSVNKAERGKKFYKHGHLMLEKKKEKKSERRINTLTSREATVVYVKYQITITFTKLPEAHDSIIWAETTSNRPQIIDGVCLFWGQFEELMLFAVQYQKMKWHHQMFVHHCYRLVQVNQGAQTSSSQHQNRIMGKKTDTKLFYQLLLFCYLFQSSCMSINPLRC